MKTDETRATWPSSIYRDQEWVYVRGFGWVLRQIAQRPVTQNSGA